MAAPAGASKPVGMLTAVTMPVDRGDCSVAALMLGLDRVARLGRLGDLVLRARRAEECLVLGGAVVGVPGVSQLFPGQRLLIFADLEVARGAVVASA